MRFIVNILAVTTLALSASACTTTTPPNNYLDAEARPLIKSVDSVLVPRSDELGTNIKVSKLSTVVQGHFIPILFDIGVNGYRSHKASKLAKPMREALADYDFTADLKEEFNQALTASKLEGVDDLQVLKDEIPGIRAAIIRESKADVVMFIDTDCAFTPKFDGLYLSTSVVLMPNDPKLSPYKEKPDNDNVIEYSDNLYRNQFAAVMRVPEPGSTSENAAFWAEMSEEELTFRLQNAAKKLAAHIADDLSIDEIKDNSSDPIPSSPTPKDGVSGHETDTITLDPTAPIKELEPELETAIPSTDT